MLKPEAHSSHSVPLAWLGAGRGRHLLEVGAAEGLLSRHLIERGLARDGDRRRRRARGSRPRSSYGRMVVADLDQGWSPSSRRRSGSAARFSRSPSLGEGFREGMFRQDGLYPAFS